MEGFQRLVALAATLGFAASAGWHAAALGGYVVPSSVSMGLFVGIFAIWLPTVLYLQRFNGLMRGFSGWKSWKYIVHGAPNWMKVVVPATFVYAFANFFLATGAPFGSVSDSDPGFDRVGSGHAMLFYGVAMLTMTAAARRAEHDLDWRCVQGHAISPEAKFCEQCGAPARELRAPAGV